MTTESNKNGAITLSRVNISGSRDIWLLAIVCCLVVRLGLRFDFVFGWLVAVHTYLSQFPFVAERCPTVSGGA